jgi:6-phosphofructokinase 1
MEERYRKKTLAIVVGGGPAPGINGVIRSATIEAINNGLNVIGIYDGFEHLMKGESNHTVELKIDDVTRIHYSGGSILRTSRANPTKSQDTLEATIKALSKLSVDYLVTIGGDDTATTAAAIDNLTAGQLQVAHVPKTIDNDLPLPGNRPTFGYQTAREIGFQIVQSLMMDAATTGKWFFIVSMGRKAGHLALGIGKAAGATLTVIGEEFRDKKISFETVCDILEASIIKRLANGSSYGLAVLAEGIITKINPEELINNPHVSIEEDVHGNMKFSEIDLGRITKDEVKRRFKERGIDMSIISKDVGYELRCAPPNPYDCEYTQDLGYAAIRFLLDGDTGAIITIDRCSLIPVKFTDVIEANGRISSREVDIDSDSYKVARKYMIRLESEDFIEKRNIARLATIGNMKAEEFENRFRYLTNDPPVKE